MANQIMAFIGGGNMARALIGGLIHSGHPPEQIIVSDPNLVQRQWLEQHFGVKTVSDNQALCDADVLVLAVKPQILAQVVKDIAPYCRASLVISIAAGVRSLDMVRWFAAAPKVPAVIRVMPNTPALVNAGASGLYAASSVSSDHKNIAEHLMRACGICVWVDTEQQLDAVTALSGSGPAYFFLVMEAMEKTAIEAGLSAEMVKLLTVQTAFGAAKLALESQESPAILRQQVTSPNGTTEQAIQVLQTGGLEPLFKQAMLAAHDRAQTMAVELGRSA